MKSNFDYLEKIIDNINDKMSDEYRYLRDFNFLLRETEKNIYLRKLVQASYTLRMCWDLSRQLIYYLIKNSDNALMSKWDKNIKDRLKLVRQIYEKRGKHYEPTTPGFGTLFEEYPSHVDQHIEGVGTTYELVKLFKEMNKWMHYNYDTNYKTENVAGNKHDKSTLYHHRGDVRYKSPSVDETIDYLSAIWHVTIDAINKSELDPSGDIPDFDRLIYDDPEIMFTLFMTNSYVNKFTHGGHRCPICKEGTYNKPNYEELIEKNVKFPHGPYISCSKEGCWAKLDDSLKIKRTLKYDQTIESTCPSCRKEDALQQRVNLREGRGTYVYKACKYCKWNSKNTNAEVADEFIKDIMSEFEDFNWEDQ